MYRIACYYEDVRIGRNDGNPLYVFSFLKRAQFYADQILGKKLDESVIQFFPLRNGTRQDDPRAKQFADWLVKELDSDFHVDHIIPDPKHLDAFRNYDLNVWVDWGEDGLRGVLPYDPKWPDSNVLYWASDTHLGHDYRLERARQSDIVFCAQKDASESFKKAGVEATWLPHAFEPLAYPRYNLASKKHDICFVGNVNNNKRVELLDRAFKEFPEFYYGQKRFEDAARKYAESRVVLNCAMIKDLNMRCFEVMGSGNLLATDIIPSMADLFTEGRHYIGWNDLDEMVDKVRAILKDKERANIIRNNAYNECMEHHTIANRVTKMFKSALKLLKKEKVHVNDA